MKTHYPALPLGIRATFLLSVAAFGSIGLSPQNAHADVPASPFVTAETATNQVAETPTAELEQSARTAVEAKEFAHARELYRVLVTREPSNLEYQLALGRVASYLQDYDGADKAYDAVLSQRPDSVDALIGKSYVQMWQQRYQQAEKLLVRALQITSTSVDARIANVRLLRSRGRASQARKEAQAISQTNPDNSEAQELLRDIVLPPRYEIQKGLERENLASGTDNTRAFLNVTSLREQGRIGLSLERWRRFGDNENRFGVVASQRLNERWSINGNVFLSPNATIVPEIEYSIGAARSLTKRAVLALTYRNTRFSTATSKTLSPSLEYYFRDPSWIQLTLHRNKTFNRETDSENRNNSYSLRYNRQMSEELLLYAGFGRGRESFDNVLTPTLGSIEQSIEDNYLLGAKWQFSQHYSLEAFGLRRSREGQKAHTLGLSLTSRL